MRRKKGTSLVMNEERILAAALELLGQGSPNFHGYGLNKYLEETGRKPLVMSTLYRSLDRLRDRGLLESSWALAPDTDQWRRVHSLTGDGISVAETLAQQQDAGSVRRAY